MSKIILKTKSNIESAQLHTLIEKAYRFSKNDFTIDYEDNGKPYAIIDSTLDKGAGLSLDISKDGMKAMLSLFPPLNYGGHLDNEKLEDFLLDEQGLDEELINWDRFKEMIDDYLNGYIVYQEVIAEGIQKQDGIDARYDQHFELEEKKPKLLADGSVDFKDINNIVMVDEDVKLLTYYPETEGIDGKKVDGEPIPARKGKKINIRIGGGVIFNEEESVYYSTLAGHITFNSNRLNVNSIYKVEGDVDYSEGNIEFSGTVIVSGDVISGFEVIAKNIIIWGITKDATLIADEDISVRTGIFSTGKGVIKAGNTVTTTFIEGAEVHAGVAVVVRDYLYNSKVFCEGEILALAGQGSINGGELHAFSNIEAKQIGKANTSSFPVHVGVKYALNKRIEELIQQKANIEKTLEQTDKKIRALAKKNADLKSKEQLKEIIAHRSTLYEKYDGIDAEIEDLIKKSLHPMPYILAKDEVNEGVKIVIYGTEYVVQEKMNGAKFIFNQNTGHVVAAPPDTSTEYDPKKRK